ncbi:MAG: lysozyme inhibitor LprI family protein [Eikenella sp.]|nr:lysozyme inhibitor LprI family protein [Eikenella sp.]
MKYLLPGTLLAALLLAACDGQNPPADKLSCESPAVIDAIKAQIRDQAVLRVSTLEESNIGLPGDFGQAEATAALSALGVDIDNIRTLQAAGQNHPLSCEASLRLNPPAETRQKLQESFSHYMTVHETDGVDLDGILLNHGFKTDVNKGYILPLPYTVAAGANGQPEVDANAQTAAAALNLPLRFYLAHPLLGEQVKAIEAQAASEAARQRELDALNQAQLQARLETAKTENQGWHKELNQNWNNLPPAARAALKTGQEQWNRLRETECAYYGKSESAEPLEQEVLRLECDSQRVQQRLPELAQNAETHLLAAVNEARRKNQEADQEIRRLWQSVPDDVKAIIGQDYQNWNSATAAKCVAAAQQAGGSHAGQLVRLECETEETRRKINELRGYVAQ